jgi:hypothetical protein
MSALEKKELRVPQLLRIAHHLPPVRGLEPSELIDEPSAVEMRTSGCCFTTAQTHSARDAMAGLAYLLMTHSSINSIDFAA